MSEQASTSKGIATRYSTAVFGLSDEQDDIQTLEQNVGILKEALDTVSYTHLTLPTKRIV